MTGDDTFLIGDVNKDSYQKIASHPTIATLCVASTLENLPCDYCVYKPYCGVCPVQNYALYGNILPNLPCNQRCQIQKGMFRYLFKKMTNDKVKEVFNEWLS
jgi:radical SAM protein with 4Fe4S-binding SPASM domain